MTWQAVPREADLDDFTPPGGVARFEEGEEVAYIPITIEDDEMAENLQVS